MDKQLSPEIIIENVKRCLVERDYYKIYSIIENNMIKCLSYDNNDNVINGLADNILNIIFGNKNEYNVYIHLSFLMLTNDKIKVIPKKIIEKAYINNNKTTLSLIEIFIKIYITKENETNFQLPSLNTFINFCFKLPDILSNFFQSSFINYTLYYERLMTQLLYNTKTIFSIEGIINKISSLKLYEELYSSFAHTDFSDEILNDYVNMIQDNELHRESFITQLFYFNCIDQVEFNRIAKIYKLIGNYSKFKKVDKIIRKNSMFISLLLSSDNVLLEKIYLNDILVLLKDKREYVVEEIEIFDFYMIFFSMFYILETVSDLELLSVFDGMMKIVLLVFEIVNNDNKKGIIQIFMKYLKSKMKSYLKLKSDTSDNDEVLVFTQAQIDFLNFDTAKKNFTSNSYYFCDISNENTFKVNFYKVIQGITFNPKIQELLYNKEENNNLNKSEKKNKTTYKSIKFQKKYGVYNKEERKLLEISQNENKDEINEDNIKIPLSSYTSNPLRIQLTKDDDYFDLKKMKPPQYIKDCILGINSEFKERQELSLKALPSLIESQPLDLEFSLKELCNCVLCLNNSYDIDNFDELIEEILVKLCKFSPDKVTILLCERFFSDNNCGLKSKFLILNVIDKAVSEISEYYTNKKKPSANLFHPYFLNVIFPLLNYLRRQKISFLLTYENFDLLLSKFIFVVSHMIKVSENHPVIYKALFETFELFASVIQFPELKTKTHSLIEALNAYVDMSLDFYKESFVMIYPEILEKIRVEIKYMNSLLDDKQLNEELRFKIISTLHKYTIQSDKFKESYFGKSKDSNAIIDSIGTKLSSSLLID